jgi:hypothetical protein
MIHQLDRSCAELVVLKKDEKSIRHLDILFEDEIDGEKISIANYLEKAGLIKSFAPTRMDCTYDFSELFKLIGSARKVILSEDASPIKRSFVKPSEFLASSELAKKWGVNV